VSRTARRILSLSIPVVSAYLLLFVLFAASPHTDHSDPLWVPFTADSLLKDRDLDLSDRGVRAQDDYGLIEANGRVVSYFPWTTAALTVPLAVVNKALEPTGAVRPLDEQLYLRDADQFQRLAAAAFAAGAAVMLALVTRRLLRTTPQPSNVEERWWFVPLASSVLGLGTSLWSTASRGLWQHGPGLLLLGGAWLATLSTSDDTNTARDKRLAVLSGALAGLACGVRPTNLVLVLALGAFIAHRRRRVLLLWTVGGLGMVALGLAANVALLNSPLPSYFATDRAGLHPQFIDAVASNVLGPSRGLLVFSPWLALGLLALLPSRRRLLGDDHRTFAWSAVAATGASVLVAASYGERWWAGHSYGPRFLTETLVLLGPLALVVVFGPRPSSTRWRLVSAVLAPILILGSVLLHAPGALTDVTDCWNSTPVDVDAAPSRVDDWGDPQFLLGWRMALHDDGQTGSGRCRTPRR